MERRLDAGSAESACKRFGPPALHLASFSGRRPRAAGSQPEQIRGESGDRKFSRPVPHDILWFGHPALTDGRTGRSSGRSPRMICPTLPHASAWDATATFCIFANSRIVFARSQREQTGPESGVCKSSRAVPYDMLWFRGAALTSGFQRPYRGSEAAQRASARPARPTRSDVTTAVP